MTSLSAWLAWVVAFVAAVAMPLGGRQSAWGAADMDPPVIKHVALKEAQKGQPVEISAKFADPSGVFQPMLYFRSATGMGGGGYTPLPMVESGGQHAATVPAGAVVDRVEYYLEAFDGMGNGPARSGSPEKPHVVRAIGISGNAGRHGSSQGSNDPFLQGSFEPEPVSKPFYKTWWFWTATGVVVVGTVVAIVLVTRSSDEPRNPCAGLPSGNCQ